MANYKAVNADQLDADLAAVANAIRLKAGITGNLSFPDKFVEAIANMGGQGASVLVDESITVASDISTETVVYTSEKLAGLGWHILYWYCEETAATVYRTTGYLGGSDFFGKQLYVATSYTATSAASCADAMATIDTSGNVKVRPWNTNYLVRTGTYRLIVIG